jgi:hypothetical protein
MAQASVLTDADIRRVFRIIATTRHAERNHLAFVLSIFAGLRIGEMYVAQRWRCCDAEWGGSPRNKARRSANEGIERTNGHLVGAGSQGDRFIPQNSAQARSWRAADRIAAQWSPFYQRHTLNVVQRNLRDRGHSNIFTFGKTDFRNTPQ